MTRTTALATLFVFLAGHTGLPKTAVPCEVHAAPPAVPVSAVVAAESAPAIDGPKQVSAYRLVRLEVKDLPEGAVVFWDVVPESAADIEELSPGRAILTGPPGSYSVKARVVRVENGKLRSQTLRHKFVIGDAPAPSPDPPGPGPTPPGPTPPAPVPDPLGLVKASRDGAAKLVGPNKVREAKALADANRGLASAIAAGGVPANPTAILNAWREANNAAIPDAAASRAWKDTWGAAVSAALQALYAAGKLPDKASWVEAFNGVAAGLE